MTPKEIAESAIEYKEQLERGGGFHLSRMPQLAQAYLDLLAKCERLSEFLSEVVNTNGDPKFLVEHLKERAREALKDGE